MNKPTIIGRPAIFLVDDNSEWIERLEFSLGDQYRITKAETLTAAAEMAPRHAPEVVLIDWEIAKREVEQAKAGITADGQKQIPAILITGFERPEVSNLADLIGGCVAIVERMDTLEELQREIEKVVSCAEKAG
jgi:CheY-like chemotaxis protein